MHVLTGEVVPLAPLLIPIGEIVVWGVALAVCLAVVYFAKAFLGAAGGAVGWIPGVGGWLKSSINGVEHKIVSIMSAAANACDAKMGAAMHMLARVVDWLGEEIRRHANLLEVIAGILAGTAGVGLVTHAIENLLHHTRVAKATAQAAARKAVAVGHAVERGIGADVLPRIKAEERTIGRVIGQDIPGIRAGEAALERTIGNLWRWTHRHTLAAGSLAFTAAAAWALARLGSGWVRCGNWNKIGKRVCGTPSTEIDALLALVLGAVAIEDFRALVKVAQEVEHGAAETITTILRA